MATNPLPESASDNPGLRVPRGWFYFAANVIMAGAFVGLALRPPAVPFSSGRPYWVFRAERDATLQRLRRQAAEALRCTPESRVEPEGLSATVPSQGLGIPERRPPPVAGESRRRPFAPGQSSRTLGGARIGGGNGPSQPGPVPTLVEQLRHFEFRWSWGLEHVARSGRAIDEYRVAWQLLLALQGLVVCAMLGLLAFRRRRRSQLGFHTT